MAIALLTSAFFTGTDGAATSTLDSTGANLLLVHVSWNPTAATPTITDSKSNTWNKLTTRTGSGRAVCLWWSTPTTVGTAHTVTATSTASNQVCSFSAWSGVLAASPFDLQNGATVASATSLATGSITPSVANALVVSGYCFNNTATVSNNQSLTTVTAKAQVGTTSYAGGLSYKVQTTATAISVTWSLTAADALAVDVASFKPAPVTQFVTGVFLSSAAVPPFIPTVAQTVIGSTRPTSQQLNVPTVTLTVAGMTRGTTIQVFIPTVTPPAQAVAGATCPTTLQVNAPPTVVRAIPGATIGSTVVLTVPQLNQTSPLPGTMDQYRNLAYGIIEVAPADPLYGTSLRVRTARADTWPPPPFNATVWPVNTMPTHANAEIVRVTSVAGPLLTMTRAQEGTTEKALVDGDQIAQTITKKLLDDLRAIKSGEGATIGIPTIHHETHEPGGYDEILALDPAHLTPSVAPINLFATGGTIFGATVGPTAQWTIQADGDLVPWSDNLYDIGAPASRVRHLYVGSATIGTIVGGLPLHQATHQKGAADEIANVAWTNQQNTFTQQNTFAANPIFAASNVSLVYRDTASPANSQIFVMANSGGTLRFYSADDAYSLQATALVIDRAGNVTVGPLTVSAAGNASLAIVNTSRPVDGRRWNLLNFDGDGGLYFQTQTDAAGFISNVFSLQRAGKAAFSGQVQLPNINPVLLFGGNTNAFVALRCGTGAETNWLEVTSADGPPASVYAPVRAHHFVATTAGNNFADLTCGATNFTAGITVTAGASSFAGEIDVTGGSGSGYSTAPIEIRTTASPRVSFHWPGVVASQIGMDSAGTITAWDNPGSNYGNFRALGIYAVGGFYGPKPPRTLALGAGTNVYPDCALYDMYCWDAINSSASIQNPVNVSEGFNLIIRFRDQGGSCPIYWGTAWVSHCASPLPSATVAPAKTTWCAFRYNAYYNQWHMLSVTTEP